LILACALFAQGCATLTRSGTQRIPVTSSPAGAEVFVNGACQGLTPLSIRLPRKEKGQIIRIESPGYNPVEIQARRTVSGEAIPGSVLLGFVPGIAPALLYLGTDHARMDPSDKPAILSVYLKSAAVLAMLFVSFDLGGGKGYSLTPGNLRVTLTKADGTPRVDTLIVDRAELQHVKWIRVRKD